MVDLPMVEMQTYSGTTVPTHPSNLTSYTVVHAEPMMEFGDALLRREGLNPLLFARGSFGRRLDRVRPRKLRPGILQKGAFKHVSGASCGLPG